MGRQAPYADISGPSLLLNFKIFCSIRNGKLPSLPAYQLKTLEKRFLWDTVCQGCWKLSPEELLIKSLTKSGLTISILL